MDGNLITSRDPDDLPRSSRPSGTPSPETQKRVGPPQAGVDTGEADDPLQRCVAVSPA